MKNPFRRSSKRKVGEGSSSAPNVSVDLEEEEEEQVEALFSGNEGLVSEFNTIFQKLAHGNQPVRTSHFFCPFTLKELGLFDLTRAFLAKVGLEGYVNARTWAPTYTCYTLEFISTLIEVIGDSGEKHIKFRLHKKWHTLTYPELREVLHITQEPQQVFQPKNRNAEMWRHLTGRLPSQPDASSSYITHPVLRLLARFIVSFFTDVGEPTKVSDKIKTLIWTLLPEGQGVPDWAKLFVDACIRHKGKASGGAIRNGGLITMIVRHFEGDIDEKQDVYKTKGPCKYDASLLVECQFFQVYRATPLQGYWLGHDKQKYLRLPRPTNSPLPSGFRAEHFFCPRDTSFKFHDDTFGHDLQQEVGTTFQPQPPPQQTFPQDTPMFEAGGSSHGGHSGWEDKLISYIEDQRDFNAESRSFMDNTAVWQTKQEDHWTSLGQWQDQMRGRFERLDEIETAQDRWYREQREREEANRKFQEEQRDFWAKQQSQWALENDWRTQANTQFATQNARHQEYLQDSYEDSWAEQDTFGLVRGLFEMNIQAHPHIPPPVSREYLDQGMSRRRSTSDIRERRWRGGPTFDQGGSSGNQN